MEEAKQRLNELLKQFNNDYAAVYAYICGQFQGVQTLPGEQQDILLDMNDLIQGLIARDYMQIKGYTFTGGTYKKE